MVKKYAMLLPEYLTFHVEIIEDDSLIKYVKSLGIKVGLAINPETSVDKIMPYINDIDLILFMSVNPGAGGQEFIIDVLDKVKKFNYVKPSNIVVSIDGGINNITVNKCISAGCDMVVSGSFITNSDNYDEKIKELR